MYYKSMVTAVLVAVLTALVLSTADPSIGNESSISYGFVTSASYYTSSLRTVTLTLYWQGSVYQCNVEPSQHSTYYGCDTANATTTHCDTSAITPPIEYGLQIDNEHWDKVAIDTVVIRIVFNGQLTAYIGDYFCFNHSSTQPGNFTSSKVTDHCLSATNGGYDAIAVGHDMYLDTQWFQSQIVAIDLSSNDEYYVYVNDEHSSHVSYVCTSVGSCVDAIMTPIYGTRRWSIKDLDVNQGRVYQISGWGIVDYAVHPGIANFHWSSDEQTTFNEDYGWAWPEIVHSCTTYTLRDDEYINGYTMLYNNETIRGITFHVNTERIMPHCASNVLPEGTTSTGKIAYPNRYLSGFSVGSGFIIDQMSFQFTAINNTNKCDTNNASNIIIQNHNHTEEWWVAFSLSNIDLSCGSISKVEISDHKNYDDVWIRNDAVSFAYDWIDFYSFLNTGSAFTLPLSVRITKHIDETNQTITITSRDVITQFTAFQTFDFGSDFCQSEVPQPQVTFIDPISPSKSKGVGIRTAVFAIGIGAAIMCVAIYVCVQKRKQAKLEQSNVISNGLVVIIVIGDYDREVINADFDGYLESLPIGIDAKHLSQLFGLLNYKIIPSDCSKTHWKEAELVQYLRTEIGNELFDEEGELEYDGLIVCISAHGIKDNIITSDYRTIEKTVIHRIISIKYPKAREIPRIFLFDSCEGSLERKKSEFIRASTIKEEDYKLDVLPLALGEEEYKTSREFMMEKGDREKGLSLEQIRTGNEWTMSTKNPDYKLIEIHAANTGFQAKCHKEFGSYLIYLFTKKMKKNIEEKESKTLAIMFDEIQNELHDAGKSQTKNIFNNSTGKLKFITNTN